MARRVPSALLFVIGLLWLAVAPCSAEVAVPKLTGRVVDETGTLTEAQRQALESKLAAIETSKGAQVGVLLVPSTGEEPIEQFGIRVAEQWKLGRKGVDDGVIVVVALQDHAARIEVGYGLEGAIPDAIAKRIIHEVMFPHFKQGDVAGGLDATVDALGKIIAGEPLPEWQGRPEQPSGGTSFFPLLIMFVVIGSVLTAILGRTLGSGAAAVLSFLAGSATVGAGAAIVLALIVFFLVLGSGGAGRRGYYGGRGGFYGGGFGGGGFGGGGFSGGGGGFGGGGASGKW